MYKHKFTVVLQTWQYVQNIDILGGGGSHSASASETVQHVGHVIT